VYISIRRVGTSAGQSGTVAVGAASGAATERTPACAIDKHRISSRYMLSALTLVLTITRRLRAQ
jgi:hypothetical protein